MDEARSYLRRFRLRPDDAEWDMVAPEELIELGELYRSCGDMRSALGCVYLYTALRHPPPCDSPQSVELGAEVLDAWLASRRR